MQKYDVAIIGAGVVGAAIARALGQYQLNTALIEAAEDVAMGASRANSAIVHAGYDCPPEKLEAALNVRGNVLMTSWCEELEVPLSRCGSLVIGFDDDDKNVIESLYQRGLTNGVPDMKLIDGDEARKLEPALSKAVTCALWAGTGGITCPYQLTVACAENARDNGCEWLLGSPVTRIEHCDNGLIVHMNDRAIEAKYVINAAGVFADEIARMVGDDSFSIHPRKGEYMLMDRSATTVEKVIFQTPSALGKGILVSPTVDGNCFAGPTALDIVDKRDNSTTDEGLAQLQQMSLKSVPDLNLRAVITSFAGIRAQPSTGDFIIEPCKTQPRMIHAAGICSPGLTSAPAIAERICKLLNQSALDMPMRSDYNPRRPRIEMFREMNDEERRVAIAKNPNYAKVICRCETITEAEIIEAIRRGARNVDAVKRRTRAGMGRCQGGFCGPRVMDILARELGIGLDEVTKSGGNSWLVQKL